MHKIIIKLLDNEIWIYKDNKLLKTKTKEIIKNNYIISHTNLLEELKTILNKNNLLNKFIQNNIIILINKLYCDSNIFIIKNILYNLGIINYKFIYEEDLYSKLYSNILSIWNNEGTLLCNNKEYLIDINKKEFEKQINIKDKILLITSNKEIKEILNNKKNIIIYENIDNPIFKLVENT